MLSSICTENTSNSMPMPRFSRRPSTIDSITVPIGTPISPGRMNGSTRRGSTERQSAGSVCTWAATEQITTSDDATEGETAESQMPIAVIPVPNPANPETKPPTQAPITIRQV